MIPAVISLLLFLVSTYVLIPLWRRYRARYSQYIPLDRISDHTSTIRGRVQDALARWVVPAAWRWQFVPRDRLVVAGAGGSGSADLDLSSDAGFSSDGEELDIVPAAAHRHAFSLDARGEPPDTTRRLSRE